jgi:hypothetical protein
MTQAITLISVVGMAYLVAKFIVDLIRGKFRG